MGSAVGWRTMVEPVARRSSAVRCTTTGGAGGPASSPGQRDSLRGTRKEARQQGQVLDLVLAQAAQTCARPGAPVGSTGAGLGAAPHLPGSAVRVPQRPHDGMHHDTLVCSRGTWRPGTVHRREQLPHVPRTAWPACARRIQAPEPEPRLSRVQLCTATAVHGTQSGCTPSCLATSSHSRRKW